MEPLVFSVSDDGTGDEASKLVLCPQRSISEPMWEELAARIAAVPNLIPYPAVVLAEHCREGYAAAAIVGENIVSYLSLVPIARRGSGAHSWAALTAPFGIAADQNPTMDVFEFTSSWTDPAWRGKRICYDLHAPLTERHLRGNGLGILGMIGRGSSIIPRLGWNILAWDAAPFVNSLIAVPASEFPAQAAAGWRIPGHVKPYQGPHIPVEDPDHPWNRFCYCWVSDPASAIRLNEQLRMLLCGDLPRWRSVIVDAFACPESQHKIAFLSGED